MPESRRRRRRGRVVSRNSSSAAVAIPRPRRRKSSKLYLVASLVIAVLVIAGFALGSTNFQRAADTGGSDQYVEGVGVQQELMPTGPRGLNEHVPEDTTVEYSSFPPPRAAKLDPSTASITKPPTIRIENLSCRIASPSSFKTAMLLWQG